MLDTFLPHPRLLQIDHVDVAADPAAALDALRRLDRARSPLVRGLSILELANGSEGVAAGAIGRFWEADLPSAPVNPDTFAAFAEPGWGKAAWCLRVEPRGEVGSRIVFELRADATDEESWRHFRRYWMVIRPFSHLIRRHALRRLAQELGAEEDAEQEMALPGDEVIPEPRLQVTMGIDIQAPPEAVWPWLVQMGCQRGGWYGHDLLDNDGLPSVESIHPELQSLAVGDEVPAASDGSSRFRVARLDPTRVLVLAGCDDLETGRRVALGEPLPERYWRSSWAFVLLPAGEGATRLVTRTRADFAPVPVGLRALAAAPAHHLMEAEQLRNLKRRAEGGPPPVRVTAKDVAEGIGGALVMLLDLLTPMLRGARSRWGVDAETAARAWPGDERIPQPRWSWTHGIEIDAPPEAVWPWIAQIGQGKAGFYSYQLLENLAGCRVQNADRVHPEWQGLDGGLRLHAQMPPLPIVAVEPGRWFLAAGYIEQREGAAFRPDPPQGPRGSFVHLTWLFSVEPLDEGRRTRLISRYRVDYSDELSTRLAVGPVLIEPVGFAMDRRMLLGVKERVEAASP